MTTLDGGNVIIKRGEGGGSTPTPPSGGESGGGVKYYKGTLGVWSEMLSSCPVFMPIKSQGAGWGMFSPVYVLAGGLKQGLLTDGKTTIIKSYPGNADFRDSPLLPQVGLRSFEEYVEFVRTQGASMGINEEYTEITEDEFYALFEQIKNADSAE
jgi:hypothetical protein